MPCPKGKFYTAVGKCLDCALNTFAPNEGSLTCEPCPKGTVTLATGSWACVQSDVRGTPDGTVALFSTTSESVSSPELDKLATSLTTNDTGMVTGGLLDPQSPSAAPLTVTADITTSTQSPSGEAAFTTSSSPSFYASSTASAAASIIYEETTSDVASSTAAASQQPMTIIQFHGMWGDAIFNGRAGRVFLGLRPAAGCSGAEMGWSQSFSGSFR